MTVPTSPDASATVAPVSIDMRTLLARHDILLLDADGVLVDRNGPLPGARTLIAHLNGRDRPYCVLTNSASHLPSTMAVQFCAQGLAIPEQRIISSGALLGDYFRANGLRGQPCLVLGTSESLRYVWDAGGRPVAVQDADEAKAVVLADQAGFPLLDTLDEALSLILRRLDAGRPIHLVLCNPDLIYPRASGRYGFTAGGLAVMIEAVLRERYPESQTGFVRLGKPFRPMFEEAVRRSGSRNLIMVGDQLATDILGARRFGIPSALVTTGLTPATDRAWPPEMVPTYLLSSLSPC
jgi:HAD superfamily hydrolase (TIGR01450 family)